MKPILFNTEMVQALIDGRKRVTRRVVKLQHLLALDSPYHKKHPETPGKVLLEKLCEPPYRPSDILYVRETWAAWSHTYGTVPKLIYKADGDAPDRVKWHPSIHMPKEAARLFLRVTDVWVERLQDITEEQTEAEGCTAHGGNLAIDEFEVVWDSTIEKADLPQHGWEANPWVWVISFERISKEEALKGGN